MTLALISVIAGLLFLLVIRVPIALALFTVSFLGIVAIRGLRPALQIVAQEPFSFVSSWTLSAVPLFIFMGLLVQTTGMSASLFNASRLWLSRLPGGLAVAANFSCAGFAAASGSSVSTAAAMGRLAIPEMLRYGYQPGLSTAVVASAGTLGSLIPPSIIFILYGIFAQVSVNKLFLAGILPGLLTAGVYTVMIVVRCKLDPTLAPKITEKVSWKERFASLLDVLPLVMVIVFVLGGIYAAIFTATEAGAFGALSVIVVAMLQKRLNIANISEALMSAVINTAKIFFIAIGAVLLTKFLAITGSGAKLADLALTLQDSKFLLLSMMVVTYLILGMFLDPIGVLLITIPVFLPVLNAIGFDLILFGVLVVKFIEIGLLTPPVGLNVFVIKSVVGDSVSLVQIFKGVGWFLACEAVVVALLFAFPSISLLLPYW